MGNSSVSTFKEITRPRLVRVVATVVAVVAAYDSFQNQLGLPTLGKLFGMSGALLPWWGWLLILQAVFVYALFEFVRRNLPANSNQIGDFAVGDIVQKHTKIIETQIEKRLEIETRIETMGTKLREIGEDRKAIINDYQRMSGLEVRITDALDGLKTDIRQQRETDKANVAHLADDLSSRLDEHRQQLSELSSAHQAFSDATRYSILAIYHRERMLAEAKKIRREADQLMNVFSDNAELSPEAWNAWKDGFLLWQSQLGQWSIWAAFYLNGEPMIDIMRVNAQSYDEEWGVRLAQIPNPEEMRVYKTFRIYYRNWLSVQDTAHQRVRVQAFDGQQTVTREMVNGSAK